ncbi:MAG: baseplate J/gp47 family protein [Candidatus Sericytochromatia bacterium]
MAEIVRVGGRPIIDYTGRDYPGLLEALYAQVPERLPEWADFRNEADFGNVLLQLFAHVGDVLSYYQDRIANESFLSTARSRRSIIDHLGLIGYQLRTASPAATALDITVPGNTTAVVTITKGDAFATKSRTDGRSVRFEYTRDQPLLIDFSKIEADSSDHKTYRGVPVEQGRLFAAENLAVADGKPDQRYRFPRPGLILHPPGAGPRYSADVALISTLGEHVAAWTRRETLAFSGPGDRDFLVDIDENDQATVRFGDGVNGARPEAGAEITVTYRTGGGADGNVDADTVKTIVEAPALSGIPATITNPMPANGGADRESIEHAVAQAPSVFRSLQRAVTGADYEALARNVNGVAKVRAVSNGWNQVTLFIAPAGGGKVSDELEIRLKAYFEDKRMLSQVVEIDDVDYVEIRVTATVGIESYYVREDVVAAVRRATSAVLAFDDVAFGQTTYVGRFYEAAQSVTGVTFATITEFQPHRHGEPEPAPAFEPSGRIELGDNEIPVFPSGAGYGGGIAIHVDETGR